jgi:hypothetical protein
VNPSLVKYNENALRQAQQQWHRADQQDLVILAFSGGGTRAAAFSYGVLETLRRMQVVTKSGRKTRLRDEVDVITGIRAGVLRLSGIACMAQPCSSTSTSRDFSNASGRADFEIAEPPELGGVVLNWLETFRVGCAALRRDFI